MNPYQFETVCHICGGGGVSTGRDMAAEWTGAILVHSNPQVCINNIERKRRQAVEEVIRKSEEAAKLEDRTILDADDEYMFEQFEESQENYDEEEHF